MKKDDLLTQAIALVKQDPTKVMRDGSIDFRALQSVYLELVSEDGTKHGKETNEETLPTQI